MSTPSPARRFGLEPALDVAWATVAVLGCGSVGGFLAWAGASAGIRRFLLADRDCLEFANCRRHLGSALGSPKADVAAHFLRERFPGIETRCETFCFLEQPERLADFLSRADILLVAIDQEGPKFLIDAMAQQRRIPAVYAGLYGSGWAGEVIFSFPAQGFPCYGCAAPQLGRVGIDHEPTVAPAYAAANAQRPSSDWPRADLQSILPCAAFAARVATAWLSQQRGDAQLWRELGGASAWRLALRDLPEWQAQGWQKVPVPIRADRRCLLCRPGRNLSFSMDEAL